MMSRKDYVRFAAMLESHVSMSKQPGAPLGWNEGYEAARQDIGRSIASILKLDNGRFDAPRFYSAAKL